jgi:hypothetical protein
VLRRGATDLGVHVDLLYPELAHELTPELRELIDDFLIRSLYGVIRGEAG